MFLLNVPVAIERTEGVHVFIASQVLYYWINLFLKGTWNCSSKKQQSTVMRVTLLQAVQKFSLWPTNEDKNKRFKINLRRFRKTSGLFISLTKELNSGLPWTNQATCSRTWHVQCRTLVKHRVGLWIPGPSCSKGG